MLQRKANVVFFWNAVPFGRSPSPPSGAIVISGSPYLMVCVIVLPMRARGDARPPPIPIAISTLGTYDLCFVPKGGESIGEGGPIGRHRPPSPSLFCRGYVKRGATNRYRIVFGLGAMQSIKRPSIPPDRSIGMPNRRQFSPQT